MDLRSNIGREVFRQHQLRLQDLAEQRAELQAKRIEAHQAALQAEPFMLASKLMITCAKDQAAESTAKGCKKIYAPLLDDRDEQLSFKLGVEAPISWLGRKVLSDSIYLSLVVREGEYDDGQQVTEQPLAIAYRRSATGAQRPFGFAKYDPYVGHYADADHVETQELVGLVREAAELAGIPVLPLELPPEDQSAV